MKKFIMMLIMFIMSSIALRADKMPGELSSAIARGDLKKIKSLNMYIHKKVGGGSALHWAATFGQLPVIKYLVEEKNFDVNEGDVDNSTPLLLAITLQQKVSQTPEERFELVKYFISKGADVNKRNRVVLFEKVREEITPLDALCQAGHEDIIRYVLEAKKKEITAKDIDSGIKALNGLIDRWEKDLVNPKISKWRKERTRKNLAELKGKRPKVLKMLNDFKASRASN